MSLTLRDLMEWVPEIADLAASTRQAAANHTESAEFYRSLAAASTWEGDGGAAARAAMVASAGDHEGAAENLVSAAAAMEQAHDQAENVSNAIKELLNYAAAAPAVLIDLTTNQVIPPDTSYLDDETAAHVVAKVSELQAQIATLLTDGQQVDTDLANAIGTATASPTPPAKTPSSLGDLLLPSGGETKKSNSPSEPAPTDLDSALTQLAGRPGGQPASPAPAPAPAPRLDPAKVEEFKALARQNMQLDGVPADQIEERIDAMVAAAQRPLPRYVPPQPDPLPAPGFKEGFADRWFATEQGIKELIGQGGPGAPGVLESWRDLAVSMNEQLADPVGAAVDEVQRAMDSPSAAYYLGEKAADGAVAAPGLVFGGEGALIARAGALDGIGPGIPHDLIDSPAPNGMVDRPLPLDGLDSSVSPVDLLPQTAPAGPEFNLSNPLDQMTPELRVLAEQHLTGSGETVLGPYRPDGGGPSYIEVAKHNGASYFDIGDAWDAASPTERLAANQHVLDMAIGNGDKVTLSTTFGKVGENTFTAAEIRYLEAHGYQRSGTNTMLPPTNGGSK